MRVNIEAAQANFRNQSLTTYDENYDEIRLAKDEYIIQAVANLGQRLGIKGDSIKTSSFTFRSLFTQAQNGEYYNSAKYIGLIERRYGVMYLSIVPRKTLRYATDDLNSIENQIANSGDIISLSEALENKSAKLETGIDFYREDSVVAARSNNYVFAGIGCSSDDADVNSPITFVYEEFLRESPNDIVNGLRLFRLDNKNLVLTVQISNNEIQMDVYELSDNKELFEEKLKTVQAILSSVKGNGDGSSDTAKLNAMSISYWLAVLKVTKYNTIHNTAKGVKDSASETNYKISVLDDGNKIKKLYKNIDTVCQWFKYDISNLENIKLIYSQKLYSSSNDSFKEQIICSLFNKVYDSNPTSAKIYIPLDYEFNYYCNSNDSWKIYGGINDINVRFINRTITPNNLEGFYNESHLLANTIQGDNKSSLYNFEVMYDTEDDNIVYGINVHKQYTLPYINSDNVWVINDQVTNIYASGKDAGNPNVILVYNFNNDSSKNSYKILSGADKDKKLSNLTWENKSTFIEPISTINVDDPEVVTKSNLYKLSCRVPKLSDVNETDYEEIYNLLQYSLIINICSIQCLDNITSEIIDKYSEYGLITTMWILNEETLEFEVIENPAFGGNISNVALDIVGMTNLNPLIKWHIMNTEYKHPDRYSHRWLVFDNANVELKNNTNDFQTYIYPVMMNKNSVQFPVNEYKNNLNFFLKYSDAVVGGEEEFVTNIGSTSTKYITSSYFQSVTNAFYYTKQGLLENRYHEYIPNTQVPLFNLSEVLTVDQNNLNRLNIISLDDTGNMYYTYVGTSFDEQDKYAVHIGSSETNINLGSETLVGNDNRQLFKKQNKFNIDYENNYINGYTYVKENLEVRQDIKTFHINWEIEETYDYSIWKTTFIPQSKMLNTSDGLAKLSFDYTEPLQFNNELQIMFKNSVIYEKIIDGQIKRYGEMASKFNDMYSNENEIRMWLPAFYVFNRNMVAPKKMVYLGEALYIPALLCKLRLNKYVSNIGSVDVTSNMDVIKYNNKPIFVMTSNRFIKSINYNNISENNGTATWNMDDSNVFVGNPLEIIYYEVNGKLKITINEIKSYQKIANLFTLKLNYDI